MHQLRVHTDKLLQLLNKFACSIQVRASSIELTNTVRKSKFSKIESIISKIWSVGKKQDSQNLENWLINKQIKNLGHILTSKNSLNIGGLNQKVFKRNKLKEEMAKIHNMIFSLKIIKIIINSQMMEILKILKSFRTKLVKICKCMNKVISTNKKKKSMMMKTLMMAKMILTSKNKLNPLCSDLRFVHYNSVKILIVIRLGNIIGSMSPCI